MYSLTFFESVEKDLSQIAEKERKKIWQKVVLLKKNPRPVGSIKLTGGSNDYRIRYGDYRIIYQIFDDIKKVRIVRIDHRRDIYR